jgi:DNA-binding transcriptional MerR regulator
MDVFTKNITIGDLRNFCRDDKNRMIQIILCLKNIGLPNEIIEIIILLDASDTHYCNSLVIYYKALNLLMSSSLINTLTYNN